MIKENQKTIDAIAKECGLSKMTVSRALRNQGNVKDETKKAIFEIAAKFGYHKRARLGRPQSSVKDVPLSVELVIGCSSRKTFMFYAEIISVIEKMLAIRGYNCIIHMCYGEYEEFLSISEKLQKSLSSAIIILGNFSAEKLSSILEIAPDAILLDNPGCPEIKTPYESISFDNTDAALKGTSHLIQRGCRKVALLTGFEGHFFAKEIEAGYIQALEAAGLQVDRNLIFHADYTADDAKKIIEDALRNGISFDGIFTNDEMALGVYSALHEAGLKIPDDVAICGCDNIPMSRHLIPPLSTIKLDYIKMAEMAIESILAENRKVYSNCKIKLSTSLEVRKSS